MAKPKDAERCAVKNMRCTVQTLSEMLTHTVAEAHRLQRQQEKALGRRFESQQELLESYDTKTMKELTAVLKDIAAVAKALEESSAGQDTAATGVVLLPPVLLPTEENAAKGADETTEQGRAAQGQAELSPADPEKATQNPPTGQETRKADPAAGPNGANQNPPPGPAGRAKARRRP